MEGGGGEMASESREGCETEDVDRQEKGGCTYTEENRRKNTGYEVGK